MHAYQHTKQQVRHQTQGRAQQGWGQHARTLAGRPVTADQVFEGDGGHLADRWVNAVLQRHAEQVDHLPAGMLGLRQGEGPAGRGCVAAGGAGGSGGGSSMPSSVPRRRGHTWFSASSAALRTSGLGLVQAPSAATKFSMFIVATCLLTAGPSSPGDHGKPLPRSIGHACPTLQLPPAAVLCRHDQLEWSALSIGLNMQQALLAAENIGIKFRMKECAALNAMQLSSSTLAAMMSNCPRHRQ